MLKDIKRTWFPPFFSLSLGTKSLVESICPKPMAHIVANGFMKLKDGKADIFTKSGMKRLKAMLPQMKTVCFGDYGHGEIMLLHPEQYVNTLLNELDD